MYLYALAVVATDADAFLLEFPGSQTSVSVAMPTDQEDDHHEHADEEGSRIIKNSEKQKEGY